MGFAYMMFIICLKLYHSTIIFPSAPTESAYNDGANQSSGFKRGKRLKRLLKVLSGRRATQDLSRMDTHVWFLMGGMMLLHLACFIASILTIRRQIIYVDGLSDAGVG